MIRSHVILALGALLASTSSPVSAQAQGRGALQRSCWGPDLMAVRPGEAIVQKGVTTSGPVRLGKLNSSAVPLSPELSGAIRRVTLPKGQKLVALTFDFCEQTGEIAGYDGGIVDYLRDQGVKATLFLGGKWMETHGARTQQLMADPLFEIASHGLHHRNTRLLTGSELGREIFGPSVLFHAAREELGRAQCAIRQPAAFADVQSRIKLFRFPFGACHAEGLAAARDLGLLSIQWDVSTGDPSPSQSAADIARIMMRQVRPGSIVLAHGNGRGVHTHEALPLAIPQMKAAGFTFVTVSELLAAGRPEIADTCYDHKPGDTDKYDTLFSKPKPAAQTSIPNGTPNAALSR